jgi:hypothetical protein
VKDQLAKLPEKKGEEQLAQIIEDSSSRKTNRLNDTLLQKLATALIQAGSKAFMSGNNTQQYIVNENCTR